MRNEHLDELARIRGLMDRSTRFLSLSGLSGVIAGTAALVGAFLARQHYIDLLWAERMGGHTHLDGRSLLDAGRWNDHLVFLLVDGMAVLLVAIAGALWFTWRRGRSTGQGLWDASARRMVLNLLMPLVAGGVFCLSLLQYGALDMVPSATLVFYGLALLNASKYTLDEIRWLGVSEVLLGLVASFWTEAALLFWALGFGVLHIFYGGLMYLRHERNVTTAEEA